MRKLLLAASAVFALALPAQAATTLHVSTSGTADAASQDPALISSNNQFFVRNVSNRIVPHLQFCIYFALTAVLLPPSDRSS